LNYLRKDIYTPAALQLSQQKGVKIMNKTKETEGKETEGIETALEGADCLY
jgi:hypothetical protein